MYTEKTLMKEKKELDTLLDEEGLAADERVFLEGALFFADWMLGKRTSAPSKFSPRMTFTRLFGELPEWRKENKK